MMFILILTLALGLTAGVAQAADDEIRLGVISPASGNYADLGAAERRGITMAVEEVNAAGGVLGKQVRMIVEDTETNAGAGARKAQKLIERDKVHFMLGAVSSSVAIAISEVAQRGNTIYFNTNTNSDECTGKHCHRTNFRVGPNNTMLVRAVAPYIARNFGKNWYFITHDYTWGRSGTTSFREILKQEGGKDTGRGPDSHGNPGLQLLSDQDQKPEPQTGHDHVHHRRRGPLGPVRTNQAIWHGQGFPVGLQPDGLRRCLCRGSGQSHRDLRCRVVSHHRRARCQRICCQISTALA